MNEKIFRPQIMDELQKATTFEIMGELKRRGFTQQMLSKAFEKALPPPTKADEFW